jgi:rod shape-determining protein MreD
MSTARTLAPWRWLGLPFLQVVGLTVLFGVPVRLFGLQLPEPVFAMWPVFAWAVIRPSMLAPFAVLLLGLFLDGFWGGATGLWALSLLVAYGVVLSARSMMAGQGQAIMWLWFAAATALAMGAGAFFTVLTAKAAPSLLAIFWQFLATVVLYPLAHWLIDEFEDADVRFR